MVETTRRYNNTEILYNLLSLIFNLANILIYVMSGKYQILLIGGCTYNPAGWCPATILFTYLQERRRSISGVGAWGRVGMEMVFLFSSVSRD